MNRRRQARKGARERRIAGAGGLCVLLAIAGPAAEAAAPQASAPPCFWARPELLRVPGGPRDWLDDHGIGVKLWLTQFYQGVVAGDGDRDWQYGGRGDLLVTADLAKLGLWEGLSLTVHAEGQFADDANFAGDGSLLPLNTALAFPRLVAGDSDVSGVHLTQKFGSGASLTLGKIDMLDVASKTPLVGGGGITGFWNLAFAAPPSGLVPPAIFGALASVPIERVKLTLSVYDPTNAMGNDVFDEPFDKGVTGLVSITVPIPIAGRPGFHSLSGKANTKRGLDIDDLGGLLLPSESESTLEKRGAWNVSYSFQQYLVGSPGGKEGAWGIFGQIGRSDGNPTPLDWFGLIGIGGRGLIPGRGDDEFGAGFFYLSLSDDLVDGLREIGKTIDDESLFLEDEAGVEVFYDAALTGWLRFGVDVQVVDPHEEDKDTAVIGGVRARLSF